MEISKKSAIFDFVANSDNRIYKANSQVGVNRSFDMTGSCMSAISALSSVPPRPNRCNKMESG